MLIDLFVVSTTAANGRLIMLFSEHHWNDSNWFHLWPLKDSIWSMKTNIHLRSSRQRYKWKLKMWKLLEWLVRLHFESINVDIISDAANRCILTANNNEARVVSIDFVDEVHIWSTSIGWCHDCQRSSVRILFRKICSKMNLLPSSINRMRLSDQ